MEAQRGCVTKLKSHSWMPEFVDSWGNRWDQMLFLLSTCVFSGFDLKLFYSFSCFSTCGNTKSPNLSDESSFFFLEIQITFPVGCFGNPFSQWNW